MYKEMIEIATFGLIPVEAVIVDHFELDPDEEPYNETFEKLGYEAE